MPLESHFGAFRGRALETIWGSLPSYGKVGAASSTLSHLWPRIASTASLELKAWDPKAQRRRSSLLCSPFPFTSVDWRVALTQSLSHEQAPYYLSVELEQLCYSLKFMFAVFCDNTGQRFGCRPPSGMKSQPNAWTQPKIISTSKQSLDIGQRSFSLVACFPFGGLNSHISWFLLWLQLPARWPY